MLLWTPMPITTLVNGRTIDTDKLTDGSFVRYGRRFKAGVTRLQVELLAFLQGWEAPFGKGKLAHFKRIVTLLWPDYQWNRWSEDQARALCENNLVAFMGCGGSGKSLMLAMWALINWWAAPQDTTIAVTSTDIDGGKRRVWGYVVTLHQTARWQDDSGNVGKPPGKLTDQPPMVRLVETEDGIRGAGQQSISLVAAGNQHLDSAMKVLQGLHNRRVILILDELQSLASSIIGGVLENLQRNEYFQLCAAGNIGDATDPLGVLCRPVTDTNHGYDDVNSETKSWKITRQGMNGICVRFDAEDSPNFDDYVEDCPDRYPFLPRVSEVRAKKDLLARGLVEIGDYYRQWKAFITPSSVEDGRYSAAAILKFEAKMMADWAKAGGYVTIGGCDPAYTSGGDRFVLMPIRYGQTNAGIWTLEFQVPILLQHNVDSDELRNYDIARQAVEHCKRHMIEPIYFGIDCSGENPLGDIFAAVWENNDFLRVNFQGKPSAMPVSLTDRRPCHDEYNDKCAELWCTGANFLRNKQLKNIGPVQELELSSRKIVRGTSGKLLVEAKRVMKRRTRSSPDEADAGNVGIEVARVRLGAIAGAEGYTARQDTWNQVARKTNVEPIRQNWNRGIQTFVRRF